MPLNMKNINKAGRSKYASRYAKKNLNFQRFNGFYCDFLYSFQYLIFINVEK